MAIFALPELVGEVRSSDVDASQVLVVIAGIALLMRLLRSPEGGAGPR